MMVYMATILAVLCGVDGWEAGGEAVQWMGMDGLRWWVQLRGACASEEREKMGAWRVWLVGLWLWLMRDYLAGMMEGCGGCDVGCRGVWLWAS